MTVTQDRDLGRSMGLWGATGIGKGLDPELVRLRGRAPLVLVPIAKPSSTAAMVALANAITPPRVGQVLLHSVVQPPGMWERGDLAQQLVDVEAILDQSLFLSLSAGVTPEWLTTVAPDPWPEISRVAGIHRCESILVGLGQLSRQTMSTRVEELINAVQSNVVILRAPEGWNPGAVRSILVPVGGRRDQSVLRARLLASLCRTQQRQVTYLRVLEPRSIRPRCPRCREEPCPSGPGRALAGGRGEAPAFR